MESIEKVSDTEIKIIKTEETIVPIAAYVQKRDELLKQIENVQQAKAEDIADFDSQISTLQSAVDALNAKLDTASKAGVAAATQALAE